MTEPKLLIERDSGVLTLILNRPHKLNAIDNDLGVWAAEVFQRTQRWLLAAKIRLDGGERVYQRLGRW